MTSSLSSLEYEQNKFVDREEELQNLEARVQSLLEGRDGHGVIVFTGERGVGKTWLRAHWQEQLRAYTNLVVVRVDLKKYAGKDAAWSVGDIIRQVSAETGGPDRGLGIDLPEMSRNLLVHLRENVLRQRYMILFVDHVYESDWALLPLLEDYLLAPLAAEPRVLIVLAGRGRLYPWRTPELGVRADQIEIPPFPTEEITRMQLERQVRSAVPKAPEIHRITGGNPLANYLLALSEDPGQALEGLLEPVPAEHRRKVREYLEAICVLRDFDEDRIPEMLATYYNEPAYREWTYAQARQVREELIRWAFARWDTEKRAYVLDRIIRRLAEEYLFRKKPELWTKLHQAALDLYIRWAKDYPRTRDRWQKEAQYHQERLQFSGGKQ